MNPLRVAVVVPLLVWLAGCTPSAATQAAVPAPQASSTALATTAGAAAAGCRVVDGKADLRCTPGADNPQVTQQDIATTICKPGWTATVRPPEAYTEDLKRKGLTAYGEHGPLSAFEEDHLVPLELGGSPTAPGNLWPEPHAGVRDSYVKDVEETSLKRAVCGGRMTLADARAQILRDWRG